MDASWLCNPSQSASQNHRSSPTRVIRLQTVCGYRVPADSAGAVSEVLASWWRASAASSGARGAAIIVVTGAGITVLNPGIPVSRYGVIAAAGGWFLCLCPGARSPWLEAVGGGGFFLLVCAGQVVLRTVSVAVRGVGRLDARGHGHIADSVRAADADRRRLRRSAAIWCLQERNTVKPSAQPTLVRTQHLPHVSAGQSQ